jgi:N-acetylneuraminic acid mutarotase
VGGLFSQTGDGSLSNLGRIARYDALAGTWHALPNQGLNGSVYVLAADGSDIYVGGSFTQSGDGTVPNLGYVARYDTTAAGVWNALPNAGLNGDVTALAVAGSDIYVGGTFAQTGDGAVTNLGNIARYDTLSGTWHALSSQGLNDSVFVITVLGNDLYVGGAFLQTADGSLSDLGYIARYDTLSGTWHALPNQGFNSWVYAVTAVVSDLYVAGEFNQAGDRMVAGLNHIARFVSSGTKVFLPLVIGR